MLDTCAFVNVKTCRIDKSAESRVIDVIFDVRCELVSIYRIFEVKRSIASRKLSIGQKLKGIAVHGDVPSIQAKTRVYFIKTS